MAAIVREDVRRSEVRAALEEAYQMGIVEGERRAMALLAALPC
jgi:hypothetical protein